MILWLLHYFRGYLLLRFDGVYSEKILTEIADAKIAVWNLKYQNGTILGKIFAKDFRRLRSLRKNTGIRIKILEKHGFPFFIRQYKNRIGFILGALLFLILLEYLSTFIWVINVNGNKSVPSSNIIATLKDIGIQEGMPAGNIDSKIMAQNFLISRDDLAWASLNIEGSVLNVNVTEIKKTAKERGKPPANLIAEKDGIIRKIDATSGDVRVKIGDNVHKGDILISGIIENMSGTVFVHAGGSVIAQVEKSYSKRADFIQKIRKKTGETYKKRVIEILGARLPLFLAKYERRADVIYECGQLKIMGKKVPVKCYTANYRYYAVKRLTFSEEELKKQLSKELKVFLDSEKIDGYIPVATEYKKDNDGVAVIHRYLCEENIAKENEILLSQKIDKER